MRVTRWLWTGGEVTLEGEDGSGREKGVPDQHRNEVTGCLDRLRQHA